MLKIRFAKPNDRYIYNVCFTNENWRKLYGIYIDQKTVDSYLQSFAPYNTLDGEYYILEKDEEGVGFLNLLFESETEVILSGGIMPEKMNQGLGIVFYIYSIKYLMTNRAIKQITTYVEKDNFLSNKIHQKLGFTVFDMTKDKNIYKFNDDMFAKVEESKIYLWALKRDCEIYDEKR